MLKVLSDILLAIDAGNLSACVLLDLSTASDTVDHFSIDFKPCLNLQDRYYSGSEHTMANASMYTQALSIIPSSYPVQYSWVGRGPLLGTSED